MNLTSIRRLNWLKILIVITLVLGIFFRFVNLEQKVYWADETSTSLRMSGYTWEEFQEKVVLPNRIIDVKELQNYQQPNPEKNLRDTLKALSGSPEHPPLYFLLARFWTQIFGYSIANIRSLSAVISLLAFPCAYWLCIELFNWRLVGWISLALIAVSPLHVLFAQEARQYSLWIVATLFSNAALLRAIRINTKWSWRVYTIALVLGLYSHTLFILVLAAQALYIVVIDKFQFSKTLINYCLASLIGLITFIPWLWLIITSFSKFRHHVSWTRVDASLFFLLKTWMLNFSRLFVDFNYNFAERNFILQLLIILLSVLVLYSFYFLIRDTPVRVWFLLLSLIGTTFLCLVFPDIIGGGRRSGIARYLFPCFLGSQLSLAYLLATKIGLNSIQAWQKKTWQIFTVAIITGGIISCTISSQAETWWNKYTDIYIPQIALIINQTDSSLLISPWYSLITLSYVLDPKVRLQPEVTSSNLLLKNYKSNQKVISSIPDDFKHIFVLNSRKVFQNLVALDQGYQLEKEFKWKRKIEPVYGVKSELWQIVQPREND